MDLSNIWIYDFEVLKYDWLVVSKHVGQDQYFIFHNDNDAVEEFVRNYDPCLGGFNSKHYDDAILKAVLIGSAPEEVKLVNDRIIVEGLNPWQVPEISGVYLNIDTFDLMDDMQVGLSLKAIEAHLGENIVESEIDFNLDRPLTEEEYKRMVLYCVNDVNFTEKLFFLRQAYLENKVWLGSAKGIPQGKALGMTNAKLTAAYLDAKAPEQPWTDERNYKYPDNLLKEYIPEEVFQFFDRMHDGSITDEELFSSSLDLVVGECPVTIAFGGIHGAIPHYRERVEYGSNRTIRNKDVASYYPNLMRVMGYCSRNIPDPKIYADTIKERIQAKKAKDTSKANALKLVLNTTYGAMLNKYNDLYDPLMGRSVCITGQLFLLELAEHLISEMKTIRIIQLNTDGIMVSFDLSEEDIWQTITEEWQKRTGFELEEDYISWVDQKDVNNYVEVQQGGEHKCKGGYLVRGISPAGAFNINNNAPIIARATEWYFTRGWHPEQTVAESNNILDFQYVSKASHKYSLCYQMVNGEQVLAQKVNRVYATKDPEYGTLYKRHAQTGKDAKIAGLPPHCLIDNDNHLTIDVVDRDWYIKQAWKQIHDFLGEKPKKVNKRKINSLTKSVLKILS